MISKNKELEASALRIDIGAKDREDALKYGKTPEEWIKTVLSL